MPRTPEKKLSKAWLRKRRSTITREWQLAVTVIFPGRDFRTGVVAGIVVFLATYLDHELARAHLLDISIGVGIAALAVVAAITAIFATFVDEEYVHLLEGALGSVDDAFYPYKSVAYASSAATIIGGASLFAWPASPPWARAMELGISLGLALWSVYGTAQLVAITARHGYWRMRLPEIKEAFREGRRKAS